MKRYPKDILQFEAFAYTTYCMEEESRQHLTQYSGYAFMMHDIIKSFRHLGLKNPDSWPYYKL